MNVDHKAISTSFSLINQNGVCMSQAERKLWSAGAHERKVENLYSGGIENYADWHNGYLNFGLWEDGITDYIKAAENLVHRLGTILDLNENSKLLDVAPG